MTDDVAPGARWNIGLWPYDAIVLFDWLMTVDFDQIPIWASLRSENGLPA